MYVCMYVCIYVCTFVCLFISIYRRAFPAATRERNPNKWQQAAVLDTCCEILKLRDWRKLLNAKLPWNDEVGSKKFCPRPLSKSLVDTLVDENGIICCHASRPHIMHPRPLRFRTIPGNKFMPGPTDSCLLVLMYLYVYTYICLLHMS